jgi:hypothetical protein
MQLSFPDVAHGAYCRGGHNHLRDLVHNRRAGPWQHIVAVIGGRAIAPSRTDAALAPRANTASTMGERLISTGCDAKSAVQYCDFFKRPAFEIVEKSDDPIER